MESKKCLILFLDILGYCDWVKQNESYSAIYQMFKDFYFKHNLFRDMSTKEDFTRGFKDRLNMFIVADSMVILLDIENEKNELTFVSIYLQYVTLFIAEFISKTGFLLRGGLTCGDFVLKNIEKESNIFLFSKAYNRAVKLEHEAEFPRVLVDISFLEEFHRIYKLEDLARGFIKPYWGIYYLDYYYKIEKYLPPYLGEKLLLNIKNIVTDVYRKNRKRLPQKIRDKYFYFRDYHNRFIIKTYKAQISDKDIKDIGLKRQDALKELEYLGIVERSPDFFVKTDVEPDLGIIAQRVSYGDFGKSPMKLATKLRERIKNNQRKIKQLLIDLK